MDDKTVLLGRDGYIAIVTLNRPAKLNAMNDDLTRDFHEALDRVADSDARVVILTGTGRGFCSGADIAALQSRAEGNEEGDALGATAWLKGHSILDAAPHIRNIPQPVIAAVNGVAAGAGLALAIAADLRIGSEQSSYSSLFIKRSLTPDTGVSQMLPRLVGPGVAAEMALTGAMYDAQWALAHGLLNRVVPHDQLMDGAKEVAESIAANPPVAAQVTKRLLHMGLLYDLQAGIDRESYYNVYLRKTEDSLEAMQAFTEKRAPVFKGR